MTDETPATRIGASVMDDSTLKAIIDTTLKSRERVMRNRLGRDFHFTDNHKDWVFSDIELVKDMGKEKLITGLEMAIERLESSIHD